MKNATHGTWMQSGLLSGWFILVLGIPFLNCEETLPAREEPTDFLTTELTGETRTLQVRFYPDGRIEGVIQSLDLRVWNLYNEVLQDSAKVIGLLEVWMVRLPDEMVLLKGDHFNLVGPVRVKDGLLTLEPVGDPTGGDVVHMMLSLGWRGGSGNFHWELVDTTWQTNPVGEPYVETIPIRFLAKGSIQLFKNVQAEETNEITFDLVYQVYGLSRPQEPE